MPTPNINDLLAQAPNPNSIPGGPPPGMPPADPSAGMPGGAPPMPGGAGMMPPGMPPGGPGDAGSAPIGPDKKAELSQLLSNVKNENAKTVSGQLISRNEISLMKKELIKDMFKILQQAGVDPGNPESVKAFLDQLEQSDPDLAEMFQVAFSGLTGLDEGQDQGDQGDQDQGQGPSLMPGAPGGPGGSDPLSQMQGMQNLGQ